MPLVERKETATCHKEAWQAVALKINGAVKVHSLLDLSGLVAMGGWF